MQINVSTGKICISFLNNTSSKIPLPFSAKSIPDQPMDARKSCETISADCFDGWSTPAEKNLAKTVTEVGCVLSSVKKVAKTR